MRRLSDNELASELKSAKDAGSIPLKDALAKVVTVKLDEVESFTPARESLMPRGLLADFTAQQAADLLAFLESLGRPK